MSFPLTEVQAAAAYTLGRDLIVSAGAGSGKTRVLVERILYIAEANPANIPRVVEKIAAITFTEKAAKEMKERVRNGMLARLEQAKEAGDIHGEEQWKKLLNELDRAAITTIHSFCARLLRDYAVEAGIDPDFRVMEEREATILLQETIEGQVKITLANEEQAVITDLAAVYGFHGLVSSLLTLYRQYTGLGLSLLEIKEITNESLERDSHISREEWESLGGLANRLANVEGNGSRLKEFRQWWLGVRDEWFNIEHDGECQRLAEQLVARSAGNFGNAGKQERKQVNEGAKTIAEKAGQLIFTEVEKQQTTGLFRLLEEIDEGFRRKKNEQRYLDFDDLQNLACHLFAEHPDILQKVRSQYAYLMVDEFQDTNLLQKQIVDMFTQDEEKKPVPGKRFVVGDPKQSIYRFRGADVSIFKQMEEEIVGSNGQGVFLTDNFRSHPDIICFVNALFSNLMSRNRNSPNFYMPAGSKGDGSHPGPHIDLLMIADKEEGEETAAKEAQQIAWYVEQLLKEGIRPGEIALLFRSMTRIKAFERELAKRAIPYYVMGGRGFYNRQEVADVYHFLQMLCDPLDQIALAGVLRSPFCGLSDEGLLILAEHQLLAENPTRWTQVKGMSNEDHDRLFRFVQLYQHMAEWMGKISIGEWLERLLGESGYRQVLLALEGGVQACANLDKLRWLAEAWEERESLTPIRFTEELRRLMENEEREQEAAVEAEGGDTVKLMTIHRAKGLEFPVVIIPEMHRSVPLHLPDMVIDQEMGLTFRVAAETERKEATLRWLRLKEQTLVLEQEESVRILYVAMTRAEKRLVISLPASPLADGKRDEAEAGGICQVFGKWSHWLDAVLDFRRLDPSVQIWKPGDDWPEIRVIHANASGSLQENRPIERVLQLENHEEQQLAIDPELVQLAATRDMCLAPLTPAEGQDWGMPLAVSAALTFQRCPKQYYFAHVLHLPVPEIAAENSEFVSEFATEWEATDTQTTDTQTITPQIMGTIVHRVLEWLDLKQAEPADVTLLVDRACGELGIYGSAVEPVRQQVLIIVDNFSHSSLWQTILTARTLKKEARISLQLGVVELQGIVDLLLQDETGKWFIIDYKTNRIPATAIHDKAEFYRSQVMLYAMMARETWGIVPHGALLHFLHPNESVFISITNEGLDMERKQWSDRLARLQRSVAAGEYSATPGEVCKQCPYREICPDAVTD